MQKDLDLTSDKYTWLLTIFYIAYILFQFQVASNILFPNSQLILIGLHVEDTTTTCLGRFHHLCVGRDFHLSSRDHELGR